MDTNKDNGMGRGFGIRDSKVGYVAVRAESNSTWDDADYAIIRVDPELKRVLEIAAGVVALASARLPFGGLTLYAGTCTFHVWDDAESDNGGAIRQLLEDRDQDMVELETVDLPGLAATEQELSGGELVMSQYGVVTFRTWAKHTGEEYWTEGIPYRKLLGQP